MDLVQPRAEGRLVLQQARGVGGHRFKEHGADREVRRGDDADARAARTGAAGHLVPRSTRWCRRRRSARVRRTAAGCRATACGVVKSMATSTSRQAPSAQALTRGVEVDIEHAGHLAAALRRQPLDELAHPAVPDDEDSCVHENEKAADRGIRSAAWLYSDLSPVGQASSTAIPPLGLRFRVLMAHMHIGVEYTSRDCTGQASRIVVAALAVTLRSRSWRSSADDADAADVSS